MSYLTVEDLENSQGNQKHSSFLILSFIEVFIRNEETNRIIKAIDFLDQLSKLSLTLSYARINDLGSSLVLQGIDKCINLKQFKLCLQGNAQTFQGLSLIVSNISTLGQLEYLEINFHDNYLSEGDSEKIFDVLIRCTNLRKLKLQLGQNRITTLGGLNILESLGRLQQVQYLSLQMSSNQIGQDPIGNDFTEQMLQNCKKHEYYKNLKSLKLDIQRNFIDEQLFSNILQLFAYSKDLLKFKLIAGNNALKKIDIIILTSLISSYPFLEKLKLDFSEITLTNFDGSQTLNSPNCNENLKQFGKNLIKIKINLRLTIIESHQQLIQLLSKSDKLQYLKIRNVSSQIDDNQVENLFKDIHLLHNLKTLNVDLWYNNIRTYKNQFDSLQYCQKLEKLKINFYLNQELDSTIVICLIKVLQNCPNLNSLSLDLTNCTYLGQDEEASYLLKDLHKLKNLQEICFSANYCQLRDKTSSEITKQIFQCRQLQHINLQLSGNQQIQDNFLSDLSPLIKNLNDLRILNLGLLQISLGIPSLIYYNQNQNSFREDFRYLERIFQKMKYITSVKIN